MVLRVEQIGTELCIRLTPEAIEALHLSNGAKVEVSSLVNGSASKEPVYASRAEVVAAFEATEHLHRNTFRELAK